MPTDPTARDVETARAIMASYRETPMWWSTEMAVSMATDAIARALATARAEERERAAGLVNAKARHGMACECWECDHWHRLAAAIRARGEGA